MLLLALSGQAQAQQAATPPAKAASQASAAASSAAAPAALEKSTMPKVEITGGPQTDEGLRRRESIAKSIYGREELDRQGDIDITDVLKRLPGVSMDGGSPRLRGLGGGYTQILVNGEPAPPGFSLDSLAPGDVERIEVIKGATAEFAGVAGTINVVLREPPRALQREWRSNLSYRALQPGGSTAFQWGDRIDELSFVLPLNLTRNAQGSHYLTDRISRSSAGEVQSQAIAGRDRGRSGSAQISPRLQWKQNERDSWDLSLFAQRQASNNDSARQIDSLLGTPWLTAADGWQTEGDSDILRLHLQWQRRFEDGGKLELKSFWEDSDRHALTRYLGLAADDSVQMQRDTRTATDDARSLLGARWNQPVGEAHTLVSGLDIETRQRDELRRVWESGVERIDSATGQPFAARIERAAFFVQDEWALGERWSALPGVRFEALRTRSSDAGEEINNLARVVAPVLHLNFKLDPKGRDQLRASLTRSFKMPDLSLLVSRYVLNGNYERDVSNTPIAADSAGNPKLQPELSTGLDLAFEHYPSGGGVFSIGMFYRRIDDLIRRRIALEDGTAPDVTSVPRWVSRPANIGRASSLGLELEIKGRAEDWLPLLFGPDSGVQLRGAWNLYRSEVDQIDGPDNRLEAQPPWLANMGFDARIAGTGWTVGASLVLQPGYRTQQTDRQLSRRSSVQTLDAFAAWRVDRSSQLRIGLVNLLAPDNVSANSTDDIDGFTASNSTRRNTLRGINASWVQRF